MNESLLPTRNALQGTEVLRVVGADGKPLRVPLSALLDAAEARFATNSREDAKVGALWQEISALIDRLKALEAAPASGNSLQSQINAIVTGQATDLASINTLRTSLNMLTARVVVLEDQIKTKKDK